MWLTGLVAPWHVGSSQTRARTRVLYIGWQILNDCATREAPKALIFKLGIHAFMELMWKALIFKLGIHAFMELMFSWERRHTNQPNGCICVM